MYLVVCLSEKLRHLIDRWARPGNGYREGLAKDMEKLRAGVFLMPENEKVAILLWRLKMKESNALRVFKVEELNRDQLEEIINSYYARTTT